MNPRGWNQLAPVWQHFELQGLNPRSLAPFHSLMHGRVLVVGSGQGLLVRALREWGYEAMGVDSSPEMVGYAKRRVGIDSILADGRNLPFCERSFDTVVISGGVLDGLGENERLPLLNQCRSILNERGTVLVAALQPSAQLLEIGRGLGYIMGNVESHSRIIQIWRAGNCRRAWERLCAAWTRCGLERASSLVQRYFRHLAQISASVERFARLLENHSIVPSCYFDAHPVFEKHLFESRESLRRLLLTCSLCPIRWSQLDHRACLVGCVVRPT
jgi:SAM-dependent methyltransferase